jgi:hypothetical protein
MLIGGPRGPDAGETGVPGLHVAASVKLTLKGLPMSIAERVTDHLHPQLAALKANPSGDSAFWERMEAERTPLIEPDPARPGHSLVTFVFPIPEGAKHVVISPGFGRATDNVLDRILGTNVGYASYRYRNDVRVTYGFLADMPLIEWEQATDAEWKAFQEAALVFRPSPDPHGRETFVSRAGEGQPDNVASVLSLPDAPDQSIVRRRTDVPRGKLDRQMLTSAVLSNERRIWVYTPPGYDPGGAPYPLLVAFDGGASLTVTPIHRTLENLLAEGRVRPMVAVFVDNPRPPRAATSCPAASPSPASSRPSSSLGCASTTPSRTIRRMPM